jgi:hypothetical protein
MILLFGSRYFFASIRKFLDTAGNNAEIEGEKVGMME